MQSNSHVFRLSESCLGFIPPAVPGLPSSKAEGLFVLSVLCCFVTEPDQTLTPQWVSFMSAEEGMPQALAGAEKKTHLHVAGQTSTWKAILAEEKCSGTVCSFICFNRNLRGLKDHCASHQEGCSKPSVWSLFLWSPSASHQATMSIGRALKINGWIHSQRSWKQLVWFKNPSQFCVSLGLGTKLLYIYNTSQNTVLRFYCEMYFFAYRWELKTMVNFWWWSSKKLAEWKRSWNCGPTSLSETFLQQTKGIQQSWWRENPDLNKMKN